MTSIMFLPTAVLAVASYDREFVAAMLTLILPSLMLATWAAILVWEHDLSVLWHRWTGRHWHLR
jgi:hypothetical protein